MRQALMLILPWQESYTLTRSASEDVSSLALRVSVTIFFAGVVCLTAGCAHTKPETAAVAPNPFGHAPVATSSTRSFQAAPSLQAAARADAMGQKLLAANKQIGIRPLFRTIGAPHLEIFHQGTAEVDITEGLVKQCSTDAQLAAVLSIELGRMVAEREALAGPQARIPERPAPMETRIGNDNAGSFGPPDRLYQAELAKWEQQNQKRAVAATVPPDPDLLARGFLTKAGFAGNDLDTVQPLLRQAADNGRLATQMAPAK